MYLQKIDHKREAERLALKYKEGEEKDFSLWWRLWNKTQRVPGLRTKFVLEHDGVYALVPDLITQWNDVVDVREEVVSHLRACGAGSYKVEEDAFYDDLHFYARAYNEFPVFVVMFEKGEFCVWIRDTVLLKEQLEIILLFATFAEWYIPDE